jgi:ubiquinone/menaquinone biosynthesis C-methylase UbiE
LTNESEANDHAGLKIFYEREGLVTNRYDSNSFWERRYHQKKASIVAAILKSVLRKNDLVLDAGCGSGELSLIAERLGGRVASLDVAKSYLKRVPKNVENRVCASLSYVPFTSKAFDVVVCADVMEHIPDYDRVLEQLRCVCSQTTILTTPCQGILRELYGKLFPKQLGNLDKKVGHIHIFSLSKLSHKLVKLNWKVSCKSYHVIQPLADKFLSKRLAGIVDLTERIANILFPRIGTISLAVMVRS